MKKKVAMQLPAVAKEAPVSVRYGLELEALDAVAEIIEVDGSSPASFIEGARHADAVMTRLIALLWVEKYFLIRLYRG